MHHKDKLLQDCMKSFLYSREDTRVRFPVLMESHALVTFFITKKNMPRVSPSRIVPKNLRAAPMKGSTFNLREMGTSASYLFKFFIAENNITN